MDGKRNSWRFLPKQEIEGPRHNDGNPKNSNGCLITATSYVKDEFAVQVNRSRQLNGVKELKKTIFIEKNKAKMAVAWR
jgi:hypothetical protein